jgi:hypothetical protein
MIVKKFLYIKHKFVKNTNMSIQHIYIRAYGPTVSGRNRGTPEIWTGYWSKHHDDDANYGADDDDDNYDDDDD